MKRILRVVGFCFIIQEVYITTDDGKSGWLNVSLESGITVTNPTRYGM